MQSHIREEILRLAESNHSFYLYDLNSVKTQIDSLNILPHNVEVFYAMKANDHPAILKTTLSHPRISGIEIASKGEAEEVLKQQTSLKRVIYTGPSKREDELAFTMRHGIQLLNIESLTEAYRIQKLALKAQPILLRLNTNMEIHGAATHMSTMNEPTPFGVSEDEAIDVVKRVRSLDNLVLQGLHIFGASGVLDANALLDHVDYSFDLARKVEQDTSSSFSTLDFGGGLGIDYGGDKIFDMSGFAFSLERLVKKHHMENKRLIFELGRYIAAPCGYFCTTINDIKISHGMKILLCTAGTHAHRRPTAMKVNYQTEILNRGARYIYPEHLFAENEFVQVRGPLCTMADTLSTKTFVKRAEINDILIQLKTGAYGVDMSHKDFLKHKHVPEFVTGGRRYE